ncbi:MAG: PIN domain-containing protein [Chloroflexota bacterium]
MIFIDTAAFYALVDNRDPNHLPSRRALEKLRAADAGLLTHEYVVVETTALIQHRLGIGALREFTDRLLPIVEVVWVDAQLHAEAREALLAAGLRGISLVDWTSFLVMRRHDIRLAFTFDADFAARGFEVLPAS